MIGFFKSSPYILLFEFIKTYSVFYYTVNTTCKTGINFEWLQSLLCNDPFAFAFCAHYNPAVLPMGLAAVTRMKSYQYIGSFFRRKKNPSTIYGGALNNDIVKFEIYFILFFQ